MSIDENVGVHDNVGGEEHDDNESISVMLLKQMQKLTSSVDIPSNMVPVDEKSSYKTIQGEDIWDQREESAEEKTKKPSQAAAGSTKKLQKKAKSSC
ncbi:conserved hypothetical protein [Ricinus communis]|uniref:Uncharacterized protein n=1 Tax=Ricinus communis TaxID=3988 RepID=B9S1C5_RICCO|nr:conserved hypothetical protein [Ricinus communis]